MNKFILLLSVLCFALASCRGGDVMGAHVHERDGSYAVCRLDMADKWLYPSEYYCFVKGQDTINVVLEIVKRRDGQSVLNVNYGNLYGLHTSKMVSFAELTKLIDLFVKQYYTCKSIKKLDSIVLPLLLCGDFNANITYEYNKKDGKVAIDTIIYRDKVRSLLDSVFMPYSLCIESVFVEKYSFVDKSLVKRNNIPVSNYDLLPSKLIDGYTAFKIGRISVSGHDSIAGFIQ